MWDDVAYLIGITTDTDNIGDSNERKEYRQVFVDELSIGQSEFYQAQANGLKPEIKLRINKLDYNGERYVKYGGIEYSVIRTYSAAEDVIEVTLEGDVNGNA